MKRRRDQRGCTEFIENFVDEMITAEQALANQDPAMSFDQASEIITKGINKLREKDFKSKRLEDRYRQQGLLKG